MVDEWCKVLRLLLAACDVVVAFVAIATRIEVPGAIGYCCGDRVFYIDATPESLNGHWYFAGYNHRTGRDNGVTIGHRNLEGRHRVFGGHVAIDVIAATSVFAEGALTSEGHTGGHLDST
jgi:hypothetical protein